jgi:hypothetical protein
MPDYITIPPVCIPPEALRHAFDAADHHTAALGLGLRRPVIVWFDDGERCGANSARCWEGWPAQILEQDRAIRGLYVPRRGVEAAGQAERIYISGRQTLATIVKTIAHELRHCWQETVGAYHGDAVWLDSKWIDISKRTGAEQDARAYERTVTVPTWMESHQVTPIYR